LDYEPQQRHTCEVCGVECVCVYAHNTVHVAYELVRVATVSLYKRTLFISISCPFLVLTTVLSRPRHADSKNSGKIIRANYFLGKCDSKIKYLNFPHTFF
jgi:hypothetical protein